MSYAFEVYYAAPQDDERENRLVQKVHNFGGTLSFRDELTLTGASNSIVLTFEFDSWEQAESAANKLTETGEHVEGPFDY